MVAWRQNRLRVAGVDEAGRGPLAGPVVAAAVQFPKELLENLSAGSLSKEDSLLLEINDSKKLTPKKREKIFAYLMECHPIKKAISVVSAQKIDELNILNATYHAMQEAIQNMEPNPEHVLIDGHPIPDKYFTQKGVRGTQEGIFQGDAKSISIAAASILAKVHRDRLMLEYDKQYPQYLFHSHKGYGTKTHMEKIKEYGPCQIHRKSFSPVRESLAF